MKVTHQPTLMSANLKTPQFIFGAKSNPNFENESYSPTNPNVGEPKNPHKNYFGAKSKP
jgi:hypothetical protein